MDGPSLVLVLTLLVCDMHEPNMVTPVRIMSCTNNEVIRTCCILRPVNKSGTSLTRKVHSPMAFLNKPTSLYKIYLYLLI